MCRGTEPTENVCIIMQESLSDRLTGSAQESPWCYVCSTDPEDATAAQFRKMEAAE